MNFNLLFSFVFSLSFVFFAFSQDQWSLVESKNEIKIYQKIDESGKKWLRFSTEIPANMQNVVNFTAKIDQLPTWVYACQNSRVYDDTEMHTYYYTETDLPFPMSDRYALVKKTKYGSPAGDFFQTVSVNYDDKQIDSDLVRVTEFKVIWNFVKVSENKTQVTYDLYTDAGLPSWLDDKINKIGPMNTLRNLKQLFTME